MDIYDTLIPRPLEIKRLAGDAIPWETLKKTSFVEKKKGFSDEEYSLSINSDGVVVQSTGNTGFFRAMETLRQIGVSAICSGPMTPVVITDKPAYPWRGFMLDCSRHFFTVDFIKKLLEALAFHKINVFHWHLTDDQGWRLPVPKYPLLTEIGSKRVQSRYQDGRRYGDFYTHEQIREVVDFAQIHEIEVVPEIDIPGHASAILAAYPGLGCTGGPYRVEDRFGIFEDALCAGNDGLFDLAQAVFETVCELFPSKYVHIGGDEVRFNRWAECPKCKARMKKWKITDPAALQSCVTERLVKTLRSLGKTAIAWDEVIANEGAANLPKDLVVMVWRGREWVDKAVELGHRVVVSLKTEGCYLDYRHLDSPEEPGQYSVSTLEQGLSFSPDSAGSERQPLILGGQANLWTEFIYASRFAEYMTFPRLCALSESLWSGKPSKNAKKDVKSFIERLSPHYERLDALGLLYRRYK